MALTLTKINFKKNWTNINANNSLFYILTESDDVLYPLEINFANYTTLPLLRDAIQAAVNVVMGGIPLLGPPPGIQAITVELEENGPFANRLRFVIDLLDPNERVRIRCYHLKAGVAPAGVSALGQLQDVDRILGGTPILTEESASDSTFNSFIEYGVNANQIQLLAPRVAQLSTIDNAYVRLNLNTQGFMSTNMDKNSMDTQRLIESHIFASISVDNGGYVSESYQDMGSDEYQSFLGQTSINSLKLSITDEIGRPLDCEYDATLRWDLFVAPTPKSTSSKLHQPTYLADLTRQTPL